jgi:hypothetical protein
MAAYNDFVTQNASDKSVDADVAARFCGAVTKKVLFSFEKAAGDINASIWRIARISPFAKIVSFKLAMDNITSLTDLDIGFYKPLEVGGTEIDKDCIKDGLDGHTGQTALVEMWDNATQIAQIGKEAYLLAGITAANAKKYGAFDVALTGNTAGTSVGTISGILEYIE